MNIQAYQNFFEESNYKINSVMQGVASSDAFVNLQSILERLEFLDEFEDVHIEANNNTDEANLSLVYKEETYTYHLSIDEVNVNHLFNLSHQLTDIESERLRNARAGITIRTRFNEDNLVSFHLQIKILCAILPNLSSIIDHSSLSILSGKWSKLCAASEIPPPPSYLYRIHAVSGENNDVWLHTHGLNRCGTIELEVLNAMEEDEGYRAISNIIETLAIKGVDNNLTEQEFEPIFLGHDIVITWKKWEDTIEDFNCLGATFEDRVGHDAPTGVLFLYKSEEDYKNKKLSHVNEIINHLKENPLFFISNKETERMKSLATERIDYVYENAFKGENKILIKVGVEVDDAHKDEENGFNTEHLWFELVDITKNTFTGVLLNQPYYIERLNEEDQFKFTETLITDWILYTNDHTIYPDNVYLLSIDTENKIIDITENRDAFIIQLENWHQVDKNQEIIEACRSVDKLDYETSALYCRALNNFGLFEEAIEEMLTFEEEGKSDYKWYYRLSYAYNSISDYENALKTILTSVSLKETYAPAWIQAAFIYDSVERYKEALESFDKVFHLYTTTEDSDVTEDEMTYLKQVYEGIEEVIEQKRELDLYHLLLDLKKENNYKEIKSILTDYEIKKYHFQLLKIEAYIALKEYEEALVYIDITEKEGENHSTWLLHKVAALKGVNKNDLAEETYEEYEKAKIAEEEFVRVYKTENYISVALNIHKEKVEEISKLIEIEHEKFYMGQYEWERVIFNYIKNEQPELLKYVKFEFEGDNFCVLYFENREENTEKASLIKEMIKNFIENKDQAITFINQNFEKLK